MITRRPREAALCAYPIISSGVRCAETTRTSCDTPNSDSAPAAAFMTGQSESLPMITPTSAIPLLASFGRGARVQPAGGERGLLADPGHVLAQHGYVADLAPRLDLLAVQVDLRPRYRREQVVQALV